MEISAALPLLVLTPALFAIVAYPILGEELSQVEIYGGCLLLSGTYLLEMKSGHRIADPFRIFFQITLPFHSSHRAIADNRDLDSGQGFGRQVPVATSYVHCVS